MSISVLKHEETGKSPSPPEDKERSPFRHLGDVVQTVVPVTTTRRKLQANDFSQFRKALHSLKEERKRRRKRENEEEKDIVLRLRRLRRSPSAGDGVGTFYVHPSTVSDAALIAR